MLNGRQPPLPLPPGAGQGGPGDWVCHSNTDLLRDTLVLTTTSTVPLLPQDCPLHESQGSH